MLDRIGKNLRNALQKIATSIFFNTKEIDEACYEIKRALLEADIDLELVDSLIKKIKEEARKEKANREHLIKFIHKELVEILGGETHEFKLEKKVKPYKIMLLGLYGCGKTTTAAKLAFYYSKRGFKACLLGLDVHRPAAPEQLEQLAEKAKITCFVDKEEKNPLAIYEKFKEKIKKFDLCLIDTAGRDVLNKDLLEEIRLLKEVIKPEKTFLVVAADIGKAAKKQAQGFNEVGIDGIIITRMDGTAKGGGALVSCKETGSKVFFIGTGEKLHDIESFDPASFVSRLLGMGDLKTLLEKIESVSEKKQTERKFTLLDFYEQIKTMQKIGPLDKIAEMIPGMGSFAHSAIKKIPNIFEVQEEKLKRWRYAIDSMTKEERENPEIIDSSRISRISRGSHVSAAEIREMLKYYKLIKEIVQSREPRIDKSILQKIAKKFGKKIF